MGHRWGSGFFKTHKTPEFHWDPLNVAVYDIITRRLHLDKTAPLFPKFSDKERLDFIQSTGKYPFPSFGTEWTFVAGEGRGCRIYKGEGVREVLDIAMNAESKREKK